MDFDEKAELFYKETQIWPLGKDAPRDMHMANEDELRVLAFRAWWKAHEAYAALKAENERLERIVKFVNLKANMAIMQEMAHTKQTLLTTLNYIYDGTLAPPEGE